MGTELQEFRESRRSEAKKIVADTAKEFGVQIGHAYRPTTHTCVSYIDLDRSNLDNLKKQVDASNVLVSRGYRAGDVQSAREFPTGLRAFFYFSA